MSNPLRFLHEPRTEQEVVGVFVAVLNEIDAFPKPVVIERIHEAFPDCTIRAAGVPVNIEFKLYAESYNHQFNDSVLVCWKMGKKRPGPPDFRIIELGPIVEAKRRDLILNNDDTYAKGQPWNSDSFFADAHRLGCSDLAIDLMRGIVDWAAESDNGPVWQKDPKPQFDVGTPEAVFTVWSDGKLRPVLKRFRDSLELAGLLEDLNQAVPIARAQRKGRAREETDSVDRTLSGCRLAARMVARMGSLSEEAEPVISGLWPLRSRCPTSRCTGRRPVP